jgi:hypothetical protein
MNLNRLLTEVSIGLLIFTTTEIYDLLSDHLETATVFKGTSLAIQNVIKVIHEVTLDEISRQIQEAPYVAVTLDKTSDIQIVSQLATVLRYVHDG